MEIKRLAVSVIIPLIVLAAFIGSFFVDEKIAAALPKLQSSLPNQVMMIIGYLAVVLVLAVIATGLFFVHNKKKIGPLWISFAIIGLISLSLKFIIQRARPFEALSINTLSSVISKYFTIWDFSFPSLHTAITFAALPFFKGKIKYYWLVFACLVAVSRMFFALHYLSDCIAGAVIGFLVSTAVVKIFKLENGIIK